VADVALALRSLIGGAGSGNSDAPPKFSESKSYRLPSNFGMVDSLKRLDDDICMKILLYGLNFCDQPLLTPLPTISPCPRCARLGLAIPEFSTTGHKGDVHTRFTSSLFRPDLNRASASEPTDLVLSSQSTDISAIRRYSPDPRTIPSRTFDIPPCARLPPGDNFLISGCLPEQQMPLRGAFLIGFASVGVSPISG
jgi:hypothetical protein